MISFLDKQRIAEITAQMILEIGALHVRVEEPFQFTSGWRSPVYIDCRKLISYPRIRRTVVEFATSLILRDIGFEAIDAIAGGESAGIPFAAWIADQMMIPMQYVRKIPKEFGRQSQIEGTIEPGQRILLVEDLTTDGRSKINFCEALRNSGTIVEHTFVIFYYSIFTQTRQRLQDHHLTLHHLATFETLLKVAQSANSLDPSLLKEVETFYNDPIQWSQRHGGVEEFPKD